MTVMVLFTSAYLLVRALREGQGGKVSVHHDQSDAAVVFSALCKNFCQQIKDIIMLWNDVSSTNPRNITDEMWHKIREAVSDDESDVM